MAQFNWIRAIEGAVVTAVIAGGSSYQIASADPALTTKAATSTVLVTALVAFIKGIGQSYQQAQVVPTPITPAVTSAITEIVASPTPPPKEGPSHS